MNILDVLQKVYDDAGACRWTASATSKRRIVIGMCAAGSKERFAQAAYYLTPIYLDTNDERVTADMNLLLSGANAMPDLIALGRLALRLVDAGHGVSVEESALVSRMTKELDPTPAGA